MHIRMRNAASRTNSQSNEFLKASAGIEFSAQSRAEVYIWVEKMLVDQEYQQQRRKQRGAIRAYLSKVAGLKPAADHAADSGACSDRESGGEGLSAAAVRRQVHARRHRAAGASGPRTRAVERAGNATHPEARVCRVRQSEIHAVGGDLGGASVQLAEQRGVPES